MTLSSGTRIGPYEILSLLGAGGMGEVYRARDTRLGRDVAVKVIPEALGKDADALSRFQREARSAGALSDAHIVAVHDVGRMDETAYIVTELVDGGTLRDLLDRGRLPIRRVLEISAQIAEGLAAAHEKGIVHRDLKPENVLLTKSGQAKIADFGLALLEAGGGKDVSQMVTAEPNRTSSGTIAGTVAYMSPQQARGERVDFRSDQFSLGIIVQEMTTGRHPFRSATAPETLTAILRDEPAPLASSAASIPEGLEKIVARCLDKSPEGRYGSTLDLARDLREIDPSHSHVSTPAGLTRGRRAAVAAIAIAAAGIAVGAALTAWLRRPAAAEPIRVRPLTFSGHDSGPSASPDGKLIAFTSWRDGTRRIWIKQLAGGGEAPLTAGSDRSARFSPDGSAVLFIRDSGATQAVYRVGLIGGEPRKVLDDATDADWSPDGRKIAFVRARGGARIFSQVGVLDLGSGRETILEKSNDVQAYSLRWSPDGSRIAFSEGLTLTETGTWKLLLLDVRSGRISPLGPPPGNPLGGIAWNGGGDDLFYIQATNVLGDFSGSGSRIFRIDRRAGRSVPVLWADGLAATLSYTGIVSSCDVLSRGRLVFDERIRRQNLREIAPGQAGAPAAQLVAGGSAIDRQPTYSPDGKSILFSSNRSGNLDIWVMDVSTGAMRQVTDDPAQDWDPAFSPDGRHVLWSSDRSGHLEVWIANVDGSGARQVTQDGVDAENPTETPDGNWIVYWSGNAAKAGVWKIHPDGSAAVQLLADGSATYSDASPDGRYATYVAIDPINLQSFIRVLDVQTGRPVPFSIALKYSSAFPGILWGRSRWSPDGRSIYYVGEDSSGLTGIFAQDFILGRDTISTRRTVGGFSRDAITESFALSPDGSRITISVAEEFASIMMADNVPAAEPAARKTN